MTRQRPSRDPLPAVVLGDFGRDAALNFCALLSRFERELLQQLIAGPFFDEYRRLTPTLVGDLPFTKAVALEGAAWPLDSRVLVGFPGGLAQDEVTPRLAVLMLEALRGPVARGATEALVLLPCNTLSPALVRKLTPAMSRSSGGRPSASAGPSK